MSRRPRVIEDGGIYHVLNRRVGRLALFEADADYAAFEGAIDDVWPSAPVRVLAYCLMPNHWHLLLWPERGAELSAFMQRLTVTHMRRWHAHRGTAGTGPLYQGRFKSFPVQNDGHLLTAARYVERNALRARLVRRAERWRWCSLWRREQRATPAWLAPAAAWPVELPTGWLELVNTPQTTAEEGRCAAASAGVRRSARTCGNAASRTGSIWKAAFGTLGDRRSNAERSEPKPFKEVYLTPLISNKTHHGAHEAHGEQQESHAISPCPPWTPW